MGEGALVKSILKEHTKKKLGEPPPSGTRVTPAKSGKLGGSQGRKMNREELRPQREPPPETAFGKKGMQACVMSVSY